MADINVRVIIEAIDKASGSLKTVGNSIDNLAGANKNLSASLNKASGGVTDLTNSFIKGQLVVDAFYKGLDLIKKGLGFAYDAAMASSRIYELELAMKAVSKATGISTEEMNKTVIQLEKLGIAKTEARESTLRFLQAELDLTDATKLARAAQDLAVVGAMSSSDAFNTLTQAISSQQPILLRQFGITKTLDQIYREYADTIDGVTKKKRGLGGELDEVQKKQAFLNAILAEATKVTGVYEEAMNSASKIMRTIQTRTIPDLMIAIGEGFQPILQAAVKDIYSWLDGVKSWFETNKDKLLEIGKNIETTWSNLKTVGGGLIITFMDLTNSIIYLFENSIILKTNLDNLTAGILIMIVGFQTLVMLITATIYSFENLIYSIGQVIAFVVNDTLAMDAFSQKIAEVGQKTDQVMLNWVISTGKNTELIKQILSKGSLDINTAVTTNFNSMAQNTDKSMKSCYSSVDTYSKASYNTAFTQASSTNKDVSNQFQTMSKNVIQASQDVADKSPSIWESIGNTIIGVVRQIVSWLENAISKIAELISKRNVLSKGGGSWQKGGIVPGVRGQPRLVTVHAGERIEPDVGKERGGGGGVIFNFEGIFLGTQTEIREFALEIWSKIGQVAASQNKRPEELLNLTI
jgi:hypothetical protein